MLLEMKWHLGFLRGHHRLQELGVLLAMNGVVQHPPVPKWCAGFLALCHWLNLSGPVVFSNSQPWNCSSVTWCGQNITEQTKPGCLQFDGTVGPLKCSPPDCPATCVKLFHLGSFFKLGMILLLLGEQCVFLEVSVALYHIYWLGRDQ